MPGAAGHETVPGVSGRSGSPTDHAGRSGTGEEFMTTANASELQTSRLKTATR
jgi:hypothetical protein